MNVTFFVGNGFDLGWGLKTSYSDFIKAYFEINSEKPIIEKFKVFIKKQIEDKSEESLVNNWADLEVTFGRYTELLLDEEEIIELYADILKELKNYLQKEEKKVNFDLCKSELEKNFEKPLSVFYSELRKENREKFLNICQYNKRPKRVNIRFATFNYTKTLSNCIKHIKDKNKVIGSKVVGNTTFSIHVNSANHIHGTIENSNMIFGVNDKSQIAYKGELSEKTIRKIVKPIKNDKLGDGTNNLIFDLIDTSDIIGLTDNMWWERIGKWLESEKNRCLIIFNYDRKYDSSSSNQEDYRLDIEEEVVETFKERAKITNKENSDLSNRVFLVTNSKKFQCNLVKMTEDKNPII